tara:strand:- start:397 stop:3741 length:3345 start_codon:yes stop_codon:yes gene_type:complete
MNILLSRKLVFFLLILLSLPVHSGMEIGSFQLGFEDRPNGDAENGLDGAADADADFNDAVAEGYALAETINANRKVTTIIVALKIKAAGSKDDISLHIDNNANGVSECRLHDDNNSTAIGTPAAPFRASADNELFSSRIDMFESSCDQSSLINTNSLKSFCEGKLVVFSCRLDDVAINLNTLTLPEVVSKFLILKNKTQEKLNVLNGTNVLSMLAHDTVVKGESQRLVTIGGVGWTRERDYWFNSFFGNNSSETVDVDGNNVELKNCDPKVANLAVNQNCRRGLSKYLANNFTRERSRLRDKIIRSVDSQKTFRIKKFIGTASGTNQISTGESYNLNIENPYDVTHNGTSFSQALASYKKCDLINCNTGTLEPRLSHTDPVIQGAFDFYYDKYKIGDRFREETLPKGCASFEDTFYVSAEGDEVNADGSQLNPYSSISQALSNQGLSSPGNYKCTLVIVENGSYNERISIIGSGESRNLTIMGVNRQGVNFEKTVDLVGWVRINNIYHDHDNDPATPNVNQCPGGGDCNIYRAPAPASANQKSVLIYKDKNLPSVEKLGWYGFYEVAQTTDFDSNVVSTNYVELNPNNYDNGLTDSGINNYRDYLLSRMEAQNGLSSMELHQFPYFKSYWERSGFSWSGFSGAQFMYEDPSDGQKYFYFKPMDGEITIANFNTKLYNSGGLIVSNVRNVVIQNITVRNGSAFIANGSSDIKLVGNRFISVGRAVYFHNGSNNIEFEGNLIYGNFGFSTSANEPNANAKLKLFEPYGSNDHSLLFMYNAGENISVKNNVIVDGINSIRVSKATGYASSEDDLKITGNYVANSIISGVEFNGDGERVDISKNFFSNNARSIWIRDSHSPVGPFFINGNVIYNANNFDSINNPNQNPYSAINLTIWFSDFVQVYLYNNYIESDRCFYGATYTGAENIYALNNVFNCRRSLGNDTYYTTLEEHPNGSGSLSFLHKNKQALFSGNFFGGVKDTRTNLDYVLDSRINGSSVSFDNDYVMYDSEVIFILHNNQDNRDTVNGNNINYYAQAVPTLSRKDFCREQTRNHLGTSSPPWDFVHNANNREGVLTAYNINRNIDIELPGEYFSGSSSFIGPFRDSDNSCSDFGWLID